MKNSDEEYIESILSKHCEITIEDSSEESFRDLEKDDFLELIESSHLSTNKKSGSFEEPTDLKAKLKQCQKERIRAHEDANYQKAKNQELVTQNLALQEKLLRNNRILVKQKALKTECGNIEGLLKRFDEQLKDSNHRYITLQKKFESLAKEKKQLEEKNKLLETEKKKLSEKWTKTVNRNKFESKSKLKCKELEEEVLSVKQENQQLKNRIKELQRKTELTPSKSKETFERVKNQFEELQNENEYFRFLNKELQSKTQLLENELKKHQKSPENTEEKVRKQLLKIRSEVKQKEEALKKKDNELLLLEINLSDTNKEKEQLKQQILDTQGPNNLNSLVKELATEATNPFKSATVSSEELREFQEKYENLLEKYQSLEETNQSSQAKLELTKSRLRKVQKRLKKEVIRNCAFQRLLKMKGLSENQADSSEPSELMQEIRSWTPNPKSQWLTPIRIHQIKEDDTTPRYNSRPR